MARCWIYLIYNHQAEDIRKEREAALAKKRAKEKAAAEEARRLAEENNKPELTEEQIQEIERERLAEIRRAEIEQEKRVSACMTFVFVVVPVVVPGRSNFEKFLVPHNITGRGASSKAFAGRAARCVRYCCWRCCPSVERTIRISDR